MKILSSRQTNGKLGARMAKRKIRAADVAKDVRAGMSDSELEQKYRLAPDALQYVLQRAADAGLIDHVELYARTTLSESAIMRAFHAQTQVRSKCLICGNVLLEQDRECPYCEHLTVDLKDVLVIEPLEAARGSSEISANPSCRKQGTGIDAEGEFWPQDRPTAPVRHQDALYVSSLEAEVEISENSRRKALLKAAGRGRLDEVRALLNQGISVDSPSKSGNTPLIRAAYRGQIEIVKLLLDRGADADTVNHQGNSALWFACLAGHEDVLELLLAHGANPRVRNIEGNTPLMAACLEERTDMVRRLLHHGSAVDQPNYAGDTPLMKASEKGYQALVELLLDSDSNIDAKNKYGNTALMKAAFNGHGGVVEFLLRKDAKVNLRNAYGNTSLMKACYRGHYSVAKLLLEFGADVNAVDNDGRTALMRVDQSGDRELRDLIAFYARKSRDCRQGRDDDDPFVKRVWHLEPDQIDRRDDQGTMNRREA